MTSWFRDYACKTKNPDAGRVDAEQTETVPISRKPKHRFDFEIGYLVRSPCKKCSQRNLFPGCDEACDVLNKIHEILRDSVSCTKNR